MILDVARVRCAVVRLLMKYGPSCTVLYYTVLYCTVLHCTVVRLLMKYGPSCGAPDQNNWEVAGPGNMDQPPHTSLLRQVSHSRIREECHNHTLEQKELSHSLERSVTLTLKREVSHSHFRVECHNHASERSVILML